MNEKRLEEIEHWHTFGEPIGKDLEAELIAEVRNLRDVLRDAIGDLHGEFCGATKHRGPCERFRDVVPDVWAEAVKP